MKSNWRGILALGIAFFLTTACTVSSLPMSKEQLFQLATIAAAQNEFEQSVDLFNKVLELDPKFAPAYNGLGLVNQSLEQGSIDGAIRYFKMATNLEPLFYESWNNLGRACYSKGSFHEAEQAFLQSLKVNPDQPEIDFALAWVYLLGLSMPDEAINYFDKASITMNNPIIYYGHGLANMMLGDRFKVLEDVTQLRRKNLTDQADKLEKMVRDNLRLTSKPGTPLITGAPGDQGSLFDTQLKELEANGFKTDSVDKIKVRLKGPLPVN